VIRSNPTTTSRRTHAEQSGSMALPYTKRAAAYISLRQVSQALRDLNKALELDGTYVQVRAAGVWGGEGLGSDRPGLQ
jgi:hypothetical protein